MTTVPPTKQELAAAQAVVATLQAQPGALRVLLEMKLCVFEESVAAIHFRPAFPRDITRLRIDEDDAPGHRAVIPPVGHPSWPRWVCTRFEGDAPTDPIVQTVCDEMDVARFILTGWATVEGWTVLADQTGQVLDWRINQIAGQDRRL